MTAGDDDLGRSANQSFSLPLSSMNCSAPTPITSSARPTASMGTFTRIDSRLRSRNQLIAAAASPRAR